MSASKHVSVPPCGHSAKRRKEASAIRNWEEKRSPDPDGHLISNDLQSNLVSSPKEKMKRVHSSRQKDTSKLWFSGQRLSMWYCGDFWSHVKQMLSQYYQKEPSRVPQSLNFGSLVIQQRSRTPSSLLLCCSQKNRNHLTRRTWKIDLDGPDANNTKVPLFRKDKTSVLREYIECPKPDRTFILKRDRSSKLKRFRSTISTCVLHIL